MTPNHIKEYLIERIDEVFDAQMKLQNKNYISKWKALFCDNPDITDEVISENMSRLDRENNVACNVLGDNRRDAIKDVSAACRNGEIKVDVVYKNGKLHISPIDLAFLEYSCINTTDMFKTEQQNA
jgi:hypothetical protein